MRQSNLEGFRELSLKYIQKILIIKAARTMLLKTTRNMKSKA